MTKEENAERMRAYRRRNPDFEHDLARKLSTKAERDRTKLAALTRYGKGGEPACCWEGCNVTDPDMLSIDHVNDDGAEHRKRMEDGRRRTCGGSNFYRMLRQTGYPDGYQTLCHNHQWKKEILRRSAQTKCCRTDEAVPTLKEDAGSTPAASTKLL
jgi:hypothetical protein